MAAEDKYIDVTTTADEVETEDKEMESKKVSVFKKIGNFVCDHKKGFIVGGSLLAVAGTAAGIIANHFKNEDYSDDYEEDFDPDEDLSSDGFFETTPETASDADVES